MNKEQLLNLVDEYAIFEKYLGIYPNFKERFKSPFRTDNTASCLFYVNRSGRVKFIDPSKGINYDCFDVVMVMERISFREALKKIQNDFLINNQGYKKRENTINAPISKQYSYRLESWNSENMEYWEKHNISYQTLKHFEVFPLLEFRINGKKIYSRDDEDIAYIYQFEGRDVFAAYFPHRPKGIKTKPRFIKNKLYLEGLPQFLAAPNKLNNPIITKSYKDVMAFYELGLTSVAFPSENLSYSVRGKRIYNLVNKILDKSKYPVISFDKDEAGNTFYNTLISESGLYIPRFDTYDTKDFAEYLNINGIDKSKELYLQFKDKHGIKTN